MSLPFSLSLFLLPEFSLLCLFLILLCVGFTLLSPPVVSMRGVLGLTALLSPPSGHPGYCGPSVAFPPGRCPRLSSHFLDGVRNTSPRCDLDVFTTHDLDTHDLKDRPSIYLYSRFLLFFFPSRCSQDFSFAISSVFRILFPGGSHSLSVGLLATNSLCFVLFFFSFFWKCLYFPWIPEGSFFPDLLPPFQPLGNGPTGLLGVWHWNWHSADGVLLSGCSLDVLLC